MRKKTILTVMLFLAMGMSHVFAGGHHESVGVQKDFPVSQVIVHEAYTVSYNEENCTPNWVGWELTKDHTKGTFSRNDIPFVPDPLVKGRSAESSDYSGSGYDRGHMAPAADFKWSGTAMAESFYLSNICPQDRELNAGLWLELEQRCRVYASMYGKVWMICGPIYGTDVERLKGKVAVPLSFFKVVLMEKKGGGFEAVGFVFPNAPLDKSQDIFKYACPLGVVERLTGLNFFTDISSGLSRDSFSKKIWDIRWEKR